MARRATNTGAIEYDELYSIALRFTELMVYKSPLFVRE